MRECALAGLERLRNMHSYVPKSFARFFQESPLMLVWLRSTTTYLKNRALLKNAEKELGGQALSTKNIRGRRDKHLSYSLAHRIVRWHRNIKDSEDDLTTVASAVIGSSKAARSGQALASLADTANRLGSAVEVARLEASVAYSRIVVAHPTESPTADRAFFSCLFELTNFVLEALLPEDAVRDAQLELRRLVTQTDSRCITTTEKSRAKGFAPASVSDDDDDESRQEGSAEEDDEMLLSARAGDMDDATVSLKRRELAKIAVQNVEVSKKFLEAAALRLLMRRDAKEASKEVVGPNKKSLLVARYLSAMKNSEPLLRNLLTDTPCKKLDQQRSGSEVVALRKNNSRYVRKRLSQTAGENDSERLSNFSKSLFNVPTRPSISKTPAKQQSQCERLAAARNSTSLLDQQLTILMNHSCGSPSWSASPPSGNARRRSRVRRKRSSTSTVVSRVSHN